MKKFMRASLLPLLALTIFSCQKNTDTAVLNEEVVSQSSRSGSNKTSDFIQVNLVANKDSYRPVRVDPTLLNAWGIAFSATGTPWVNSQGGHLSEVYNSEGGVAIPAVHIPSPGGNEGGNPTGIIFNAVTTDFIISAGNGGADAAARFIFVGVDGIVSAWNGTWGNHSYLKFNRSATSVYTGLALATNNGVNYLYAANFRTGKIDVWDRTWAPVSMPFKDWQIPTGYAPFNIQNVNGMLYVTYAKVGPDGRSQAGQGKGYVNIFKPDGSLLKRFAARDKLNAPWGVAFAPANFFAEPMDDEDDDRNGFRHGHGNNREPQPAVLIGNFGDGRINVYSTKGKFLGQLRKNKRTLEIDGLWAITFPPTTSTVDPDRLYFAAGPNRERDGLFGYIIKDSTGRGGHGHGGPYN